MEYATTVRGVDGGKQWAGSEIFATPELFQTQMMETFVQQLCE